MGSIQIWYLDLIKVITIAIMDETRAPVLDPGYRQTKTGYF